jgi:hypothetical protein
MLTEFAEKKHPDMLESLKTSVEDKSTESHHKESAVLNYEQLCTPRSWKMKDPATAAEIAERLELGYIQKTSKVSSSEQKLLKAKDYPECSFYKCKIVSEKSVASKETVRT